MLSGSQGAQAAALEGISVTGNEAALALAGGTPTIPFALMVLDDNDDPSNGGTVVLNNGVIVTAGITVVTHAGDAGDDHHYFGAVEPFNTIYYDRNAAGDDAASVIVETSTAANTMGGTAIFVRGETSPFATDLQHIDFDPPATGWVAANMSFDPVTGRKLFWARLDYSATLDAPSFTNAYYAPLRLAASSTTTGLVKGMTVLAGSSGVANSFAATGAKFFNGVSGSSTTGGIAEAAITNGLAVSTAILFGDGSVGTATVSAVSDVNAVSITGGVTKVGVPATIAMQSAAIGTNLLVTSTVAVNIAAGTYVATVKDAAGKLVLDAHSVLFTLSGDAVLPVASL
jgi:hypothetical protein